MNRKLEKIYKGLREYGKWQRMGIFDVVNFSPYPSAKELLTQERRYNDHFMLLMN